MKYISMLMCCLVLFMAGCGGGGADPDKPISEVKSDAETMSVDDLKAMAADYKAMIEKKMSELEPIKDKLSEIPLTEQMGDEAKALQEDIAAVTEDLNALKERLMVYVDALKEKGESVSEYMN